MTLDKFRTGDGPLIGSVSYTVTMPDNLWWIAEVADALNSMTDPANWEVVGDTPVDDCALAGIRMARSFQPMIGQIFPYVSANCPNNCLECDGSIYNRVDYQELYAVLDGAFKDSADTFHVPDLRGKTIIGTSSAYAMDASGGEAEHTLSQDEMPSHSHSTGNSLTGAAVMPGEGPVLIPNPIPAATGNTGGNGAHNNMQPYRALRYCVVAR